HSLRCRRLPRLGHIPTLLSGRSDGYRIVSFDRPRVRRGLMPAKLGTRGRCCNGATELPSQRRVPIWNPAAMPRIVLPRMTLARMSRVADEDAVIAPIPRPEKQAGADANTDTPRKSAIPAIARPWRPEHRRIVWPPPRSIGCRRVVVRHIDHFRVHRRDFDAGIRLGYADFRIGVQIAGLPRLLTQALNRVHYLWLLREKRITQALGPFYFLIQCLQYLRKGYQRFDA